MVLLCKRLIYNSVGIKMSARHISGGRTDVCLLLFNLLLFVSPCCCILDALSYSSPSSLLSGVRQFLFWETNHILIIIFDSNYQPNYCSVWIPMTLWWTFDFTALFLVFQTSAVSNTSFLLWYLGTTIVVVMETQLMTVKGHFYLSGLYQWRFQEPS